MSEPFVSGSGLRRATQVFFLCLVPCLGLVGCAATVDKPPEVVVEIPPSVPRPVAETPRIAELERQLAERQRQCAEEKRRHDLALKESQLRTEQLQVRTEQLQVRTEQLQKKLDALLAIDRELRSRGKDH